MGTGVTWGLAFSCWLYANEILGEHVTFPILATAPSVLGCVIGIYFFKEVTAKKTYNARSGGVSRLYARHFVCGLIKVTKIFQKKTIQFFTKSQYILNRLYVRIYIFNTNFTTESCTLIIKVS